MAEPEEKYEFRIMFAAPEEFFRLAFATETQEAALRSFAFVHGMSDLRELRGYVREHQWDYYDVLKMVSP